MQPCDILVLDEPTNHLDHAMAAWLEDYLKRWRGSLIMVTHDRYFLDSVSNRIVEIDKGKIYSYDTNYSGFLELKAQREEMEAATERKRQSILRVELEWVKRGARARSTKQKARLERYEEMKNQHGPQSDGQVAMSSITTRMGNTTIEIDGISKSYGDHTFIRDFSYIFLKNDRVGFVGTNGCGKTTLMKMLAGREEPDSGTIKVGQTIKIGYYSQEIETGKEAGIAYMDPNMRVIDYIRETAEFVRTEDGLISASAMLERFLFPPQAQYSLKMCIRDSLLVTFDGDDMEALEEITEKAAAVSYTHLFLHRPGFRERRKCVIVRLRPSIRSFWTGRLIFHRRKRIIRCHRPCFISLTQK